MLPFAMAQPSSLSARDIPSSRMGSAARGAVAVGSLSGA